MHLHILIGQSLSAGQKENVAGCQGSDTPIQQMHNAFTHAVQEPVDRWTAAQLIAHPFIAKHACSSSMVRLKGEFAAVIGPRMGSPRAC